MLKVPEIVEVKELEYRVLNKKESFQLQKKFGPFWITEREFVDIREAKMFCSLCNQNGKF